MPKSHKLNTDIFVQENVFRPNPQMADSHNNLAKEIWGNLSRGRIDAQYENRPNGPFSHIPEPGMAQ
jgi:hypothetical protein